MDRVINNQQIVTSLSSRQKDTQSHRDICRNEDRHSHRNMKIHKTAFTKTMIWTRTTDGQRAKAQEE